MVIIYLIKYKVQVPASVNRYSTDRVRFSFDTPPPPTTELNIML